MAFFLLPITLASCSSGQSDAQSIHHRVHDIFYDVPSYSAECLVSAYTKKGQLDYECTIQYNSENLSYTVLADDMQIYIDDEKTCITKGEDKITAPSSDDDMAIFVNTFFESYYESESTSVFVSGTDSAKTTVLECELINRTEGASRAKLWIDNKTALPTGMQIYGKDEVMNTQVIFKSFEIR